MGLSSGTNVHAALCDLSGQGVLWYSGHRQQAGPLGVRQVLRTPGIRCRYLFVFRAVLLCQHNACYLMLTTGRTCCDEAAVYRRLYMARVISFSSSKRVPSGILDHFNLDAIWPPSITDASTGGTRVLAETGLLSVFSCATCSTASDWRCNYRVRTKPCCQKA